MKNYWLDKKDDAIAEMMEAYRSSLEQDFEAKLEAAEQALAADYQSKLEKYLEETSAQLAQLEQRDAATIASLRRQVAELKMKLGALKGDRA